MPVRFASNVTSFRLRGTRLISNWISDIVRGHGKKIGRIQYVFVTDEYLFEMNSRFLQHDYYTDIITFDYHVGDVISGELFISVDRILDNAVTFDVSTEEELHRVMAHGLLHLLGFKDGSVAQKVRMREAETQALSLLPLSLTA